MEFPRLKLSDFVYAAGVFERRVCNEFRESTPRLTFRRDFKSALLCSTFARGRGDEKYIGERNETGERRLHTPLAKIHVNLKPQFRRAP